MVMKMNAPTDAHQAKVLYERQLVEDPPMRRGGVLSHCLCELPVFPVSAAPPSVPVSGPLVPVSTPDVRPVPSEERSECVFWKTRLRCRSAWAPTESLQLCLYQVGESAARGSCRFPLHSGLSLGSRCSCRRLGCCPSLAWAEYHPVPPSSPCIGSTPAVWKCRRPSSARPSCSGVAPRRHFALAVSGLLAHVRALAFLLACCRFCLRRPAGFCYARRTDRETFRSWRVVCGNPTPEPAGHEVQPNDRGGD